MYTKYFSTNLTNIHKCLEKIHFLRQTESFFFVGIVFNSLQREKSIFSKRLWMLVKLVEKIWCGGGIHPPDHPEISDAGSNWVKGKSTSERAY
jgi:hypothetical protein